jgi:phosphate/sulfate permease
MEIFVGAIVILAFLATSGLIVGVSNDAVNFLNSPLGSKVASPPTIKVIASLGILVGVTFSSGMMEVARKGIFHPKYFVMPELMVIFLAVMLTNVILLDLYNTFGLPTSSTVSIVFSLLGAAVAVSLIKIAKNDSLTLGDHINNEKALAIILGILLSIVVAFVVGAFIQYITRIIFTFDFASRLKRYGAIWGGIAISTILYFILIRGAKDASFMTEEMLLWIKTHTGLILLATFVIVAVLLQIVMFLFKINVLKVIILAGTFAIAMAFAANDLVNFIGVPLAGLNAFQFAKTNANPLTVTMEILQSPIKSNTALLLIAGLIMVITIWVSKKTKTVTQTEINLSRQDEGIERFGSSPISRLIVRMFTSMSKAHQKVMPKKWISLLARRFDRKQQIISQSQDGDLASFDLLRASVNLVVASALISLATSMKLPLSTTYVTFMVAMGTSLSDRAWGSESAVYRVTGVLTVIGGWFFTAFMAFMVSSIFAVAIYYWKVPGLLGILLLAIFILYRNYHMHKTRRVAAEATEIFNLKKISDANFAINASFEHSGYFLQEVNQILNRSFEGLFLQNRAMLKSAKKETKKIQKWANIIIANIFKTLRLLHKQDMVHTQAYAHIINALQEIAESQRDAILRAYTHISNNHKGLLDVQISELQKIQTCLNDLLSRTAGALLEKKYVDYLYIRSRFDKLRDLVDEFDKNQIKRIQDESSKTRLSILFYGMMSDCTKVAEQTLNLLGIFQESFKLNNLEEKD